MDKKSINTRERALKLWDSVEWGHIPEHVRIQLSNAFHSMETVALLAGSDPDKDTRELVRDVAERGKYIRSFLESILDEYPAGAKAQIDEINDLIARAERWEQDE